MSDPNDFLMASGTRSFKFDTLNATAKGTIVSLDMQQQRDIKTGQPKFWDDQKTQPMMQLRVVLATEERDGDDDNGQRAIYVKGNMQQAVRDAIKATGADKIEEGGTLAVQYYDNGQATTVGFNPPKLYKAQYKPPSVTPAAVAVDDLI